MNLTLSDFEYLKTEGSEFRYWRKNINNTHEINLLPGLDNTQTITVKLYKINTDGTYSEVGRKGMAKEWGGALKIANKKINSI